MSNAKSSKHRIQQLADEAAAAELIKKNKEDYGEIVSQKEEKAKTVTKKEEKTSTKKAATSERKKLVWKIFDDSFKEMGCFPYPEKEKAFEAAEELRKSKGKNYFVNDVSVPMED